MVVPLIIRSVSSSVSAGSTRGLNEGDSSARCRPLRGSQESQQAERTGELTRANEDLQPELAPLAQEIKNATLIAISILLLCESRFRCMHSRAVGGA